MRRLSYHVRVQQEVNAWQFVDFGGEWQIVATQEPSATAGSVSLTDPAAPLDAALYRVQVAAP